MDKICIRENEIMPVANRRFAKAGVSCFYDSKVLNSSFVHLMKFSAKNPRLRKARNRKSNAKTLVKPYNYIHLTYK